MKYPCLVLKRLCRTDISLQMDREGLNEYGEPISKLFAAGEIVGGLHGTSYIGGCSLAGALALGRMVGEQLAKNQAAP